jgi:hypothetical protein
MRYCELTLLAVGKDTKGNVMDLANPIWEGWWEEEPFYLDDCQGKTSCSFTPEKEGDYTIAVRQYLESTTSEPKQVEEVDNIYIQTKESGSLDFPYNVRTQQRVKRVKLLHESFLADSKNARVNRMS